jgi:outer membrane receptor protein involved in Fe transport
MLMASTASSAYAQAPSAAGEQASSPAPEQSGGLEEIVVTASLREQTTLEVPASLTALTGKNLEHIGADSYEDYLSKVPGVSYNANGFGRGVIIIRGVATGGSSNGNLQPSTAQYIDELPALNLWSAWTATDLRMVDIDRVEVLRGPQGTLFGSGSLGGAVRIITNKPDPTKFAGNLSAGGAVTDKGAPSYDTRLMLNVPIISDKLALRAVVYGIREGGYIDNVPRGEDDVNYAKSFGYRVSLGFTPSDALTMRLSATHQKDDVGDGVNTFYSSADGGPYENGGVGPQRLDTTLDIYNFTTEYDFGPAALTWSSTYAERKSYSVQDMIRRMNSVWGYGLNYRDYTDFIQHDYDTTSHEVRISSYDKGPIDWVIGGFRMKQDLNVTQIWDYNYNDIYFLDSVYLADSRQQALFGEATYHLSDKWAFTAGLRYFDNKFAFEVPRYFGQHAINTGATTTPLTITKENGFTPKFALSFTPSEATNIYANVAKGYRVGQVNFGASAGARDPISGEVVPLTFEPDYLWNYEIGVKTYLFDRMVRVDAALFYIDWKNIQYTRFTASRLNYTGNAGDAESKGAELSLIVKPSANWEFGVTATYTDAKLTSAREGASLVPGRRLPGTPEFAMSDYVEYTGDMGDANFFVRLSHRYQTKQVQELSAAVGTPYAPGYHKVDARAGVTLGDYSLSLFVDNLTNSDAETLVASSTSAWDPQRRTYRLRPLTAGATLSVNF